MDIVAGWVKHRADKRGKVAKLKYKSFVTSLERPDKKTGWVGKKLIVHLPIRVTKCVWMASLYHHFFTRLCKAHRISLSFRLIIEIKTIYSYLYLGVDEMITSLFFIRMHFIRILKAKVC